MTLNCCNEGSTSETKLYPVCVLTVDCTVHFCWLYSHFNISLITCLWHLHFVILDIWAVVPVWTCIVIFLGNIRLQAWKMLNASFGMLSLPAFAYVYSISIWCFICCSTFSIFSFQVKPFHLLESFIFVNVHLTSYGYVLWKYNSRFSVPKVKVKNLLLLKQKEYFPNTNLMMRNYYARLTWLLMLYFTALPYWWG